MPPETPHPVHPSISFAGTRAVYRGHQPVEPPVGLRFVAGQRQEVQAGADGIARLVRWRPEDDDDPPVARTIEPDPDGGPLEPPPRVQSPAFGVHLRVDTRDLLLGPDVPTWDLSGSLTVSLGSAGGVSLRWPAADGIVVEVDAPAGVVRLTCAADAVVFPLPAPQRDVPVLTLGWRLTGGRMDGLLIARWPAATYRIGGTLRTGGGPPPSLRGVARLRGHGAVLHAVSLNHPAQTLAAWEGACATADAAWRTAPPPAGWLFLDCVAGESQTVVPVDAGPPALVRWCSRGTTADPALYPDTDGRPAPRCVQIPQVGVALGTEHADLLLGPQVPAWEMSGAVALTSIQPAGPLTVAFSDAVRLELDPTAGVARIRCAADVTTLPLPPPQPPVDVAVYTLGWRLTGNVTDALLYADWPATPTRATGTVHGLPPPVSRGTVRVHGSGLILHALRLNHPPETETDWMATVVATDTAWRQAPPPEPPWTAAEYVAGQTQVTAPTAGGRSRLVQWSSAGGPSNAPVMGPDPVGGLGGEDPWCVSPVPAAVRLESSTVDLLLGPDVPAWELSGSITVTLGPFGTFTVVVSDAVRVELDLRTKTFRLVCGPTLLRLDLPVPPPQTVTTGVDKLWPSFAVPQGTAVSGWQGTEYESFGTATAPPMFSVPSDTAAPAPVCVQAPRIGLVFADPATPPLRLQNAFPMNQSQGFITFSTAYGVLWPTSGQTDLIRATGTTSNLGIAIRWVPQLENNDILQVNTVCLQDGDTDLLVLELPDDVVGARLYTVVWSVAADTCAMTMYEDCPGTAFGRQTRTVTGPALPAYQDPDPAEVRLSGHVALITHAVRMDARPGIGDVAALAGAVDASFETPVDVYRVRLLIPHRSSVSQISSMFVYNGTEELRVCGGVCRPNVYWNSVWETLVDDSIQPSTLSTSTDEGGARCETWVRRGPISRVYVQMYDETISGMTLQILDEWDAVLVSEALPGDSMEYDVPVTSVLA